MEKTTIGIELPKELQNAEILVPDMNEGRKLAIVSLDVLEYLTSLLPSAPFWKIRRDFRDKIGATENIEQMIMVAKKELDFHTSVNMITTFFTKVPDTNVVVDEPAVAEPTVARKTYDIV